ncbi:beta-galactosidase-1-like protein 2 isoform X1 [Gallus gallus]|uniref:Beta-galactosidase n=1 Tax=Gallus gallus TaxID=9031 RepID=A0A8V1AA85_CHICK|nr:beta-galactosidase-1-like protein 2 isoform X1 [Gallus gallus]XP_040546435.1 beta-galactosidase-1-like protein 2 isoform X1 [Gallus gallus]
MWPCGGRRQRRFGGVALLLLVLWLLARRYYPCLPPVVSEPCENAVVHRFNWSELVPLRLWGRTLGLQTEHSQFLLEGMPFRIFGGSVHYFRVPREYWEDRMLKMKACGLNTLTTYVPWNLHEQTRGKFDFSENLDLEAFLSLAAKNGLWVILRPGPYICSEWDLGGLPSWLLQDPEMQLRTTYKGFTEAVDAYFDHLMPIVVPLQYKRGGPIIAVQVENEYGSYAKDPNYMAYVKRALLSRGIVELLMTSDNKNGLSFGLVEGALATVNFQKLEPGVLKYLDTVQRDQPKMVMEYWTGWFDNWGGPHYVFDADEMVNTVASILKLGASINLYMFHGGTNFGFMNGALKTDEYKSDVTSYDYDAVLTEAGDYTSKFFKLRQLFSTIIGQPLPLPPMIESKASYGAILLHQYISLWDVLPSLVQPIKSEFPVNMENLQLNDSSGQSYGYVLYETVIFGGGHLHSRDHVRDRAQVFVNTMYVGELDYNTVELSLPEGQGFRQLRLLVENRGRVNYGLALNEQRKGLIGDIFLNKTPLRNFKIYSLEMKPDFLKSLRHTAGWSAVPDYFVGPAFFRGRLWIEHQPQDTFLKLQGWEKGVVFVNGHNLGRYWKIGPQETLYLPGPWLQKGSNEIIIFEERTAGRIIQSVDIPYLGRTQYVD